MREERDGGRRGKAEELCVQWDLHIQWWLVSGAMGGGRDTCPDGREGPLFYPIATFCTAQQLSIFLLSRGSRERLLIIYDLSNQKYLFDFITASTVNRIYQSSIQIREQRLLWLWILLFPGKVPTTNNQPRRPKQTTKTANFVSNRFTASELQWFWVSIGLKDGSFLQV